MSVYVSRFPDAVLVSDRMRDVSAQVGRKNKGKPTWSKGKKFDDVYRQHIKESHWARKPVEETLGIRAQCALNGQRAMQVINADGRAFRMPKGFWSEEHKQYMSELMMGREVTWSDKIKASHWSRKPIEDVQAIIDRIQQNGWPANTKRGWFFSKKMGEQFFFMSSYEERRLAFLDTCDDVVSFTNRHKIWVQYTLNGEKHRYTPDMLLTFKDGTRRIEEIKGFVGDVDRILAKETAIKAYAHEQNIQYKMVFEAGLEVL
jgi:hypothetical protein